MEYIAENHQLKKSSGCDNTAHTTDNNYFCHDFHSKCCSIASAVTSPVASCDFMIAPESRTSPTAIITSAQKTTAKITDT